MEVDQDDRWRFDRLVKGNRGTDGAIAAAKAMHTKLPGCDMLADPVCPVCEQAGAEAVAAAELVLGDALSPEDAAGAVDMLTGWERSS